MIHFLAHWLGLDSPSGPIYATWSGWLADLTIVSAVVEVVRRMVRHHTARLAQAERHHLEARAQAQAHHNALLHQAEKHHQRLWDQAQQHHDALRQHIAAAIPTRKAARGG